MAWARALAENILTTNPLAIQYILYVIINYDDNVDLFKYIHAYIIGIVILTLESKGS